MVEKSSKAGPPLICTVLFVDCCLQIKSCTVLGFKVIFLVWVQVPVGQNKDCVGAKPTVTGIVFYLTMSQ